MTNSENRHEGVPYTDFHTHKAPAVPGARSILNVRQTGAEIPSCPCSIGLHPWDIGPGWESRMERVRSNTGDTSVVAIGETGLDRLRGGDMALQEAAFTEHIKLAEQCRKPLIIHCVKAFDRIMELRKRHPEGAWMVHGFRGKPEMAAQLMRQGIYLSFGPRHNAEALRKAFEAGKMLLETDEAAATIADVYEAAAAELGASTDDVKAYEARLARGLFGI